MPDSSTTGGGRKFTLYHFDGERFQRFRGLNDFGVFLKSDKKAIEKQRAWTKRQKEWSKACRKARKKKSKALKKKQLGGFLFDCAALYLERIRDRKAKRYGDLEMFERSDDNWQHYEEIMTRILMKSGPMVSYKEVANATAAFKTWENKANATHKKLLAMAKDLPLAAGFEAFFEENRDAVDANALWFDLVKADSSLGAFQFIVAQSQLSCLKFYDCKTKATATPLSVATAHGSESTVSWLNSYVGDLETDAKTSESDTAAISDSPKISPLTQKPDDANAEDSEIESIDGSTAVLSAGASPKIALKCHCGESLKKSKVVDCFGPGFTVTCDGCRESVGGSDDIYKCPMGDSAAHSGGSEFCLKCATSQKGEGESDLQPAVGNTEDTKEEISDSGDWRSSFKSKRGRGKKSTRDIGRGGRGRGVRRGERGRGRGHDYGRGGGRRRERGRDHGYDYGRRFESDGRGHAFDGGFQHGRGRHPPVGPKFQPEHYPQADGRHFADRWQRPPAPGCRPHGAFHGGHRIEGHPRGGDFRGHRHPESEAGHRFRRPEHARGRGKGKDIKTPKKAVSRGSAAVRISDESLVSRTLDTKIDSTSAFRVCFICAMKCQTKEDWISHIRGEMHSAQAKIKKYCDSCKSVMKATEWSRHCLTRAHYDDMDETTRNRVVDAHCRDCDLDFHTHGEWTLHLMSFAHNRLEKIRLKAKAKSTRVCHLCQRTVDYSTSTAWTTHIESEEHKAMKVKFTQCTTCEKRVEAALWGEHCQTQEHYDKLPEAKRIQVVDKECYYCRDVFCKTMGEWALHCVSDAHKTAAAKAKARKLLKTGEDSIDVFVKPTKTESPFVRTKFPHTCKLCEVVCSTPSKWRVHESSQEHTRSVHLKRYCVVCDRVMRRSDFEAHQFTQAHLEQMDDDSKNEVVNRWCVYCDDVLCVTQERWILHCMSPEHRRAEAAAKGEDVTDESDTKFVGYLFE